MNGYYIKKIYIYIVETISIDIFMNSFHINMNYYKSEVKALRKFKSFLEFSILIHLLLFIIFMVFLALLFLSLLKIEHSLSKQMILKCLLKIFK